MLVEHTRFNEAEAFTPRIPCQKGALSVSRQSRFNEAEAFTPRILRLRNRSVRARRCFNEAEAFTPRIPILIALGYLAATASMRPRLLHLGSRIKSK